MNNFGNISSDLIELAIKNRNWEMFIIIIRDIQQRAKISVLSIVEVMSFSAPYGYQIR